MAPVRKKVDRQKLLAAARVGGAAAQLALAKSYERQAPVDLSRAKHWYLKAATQGLAEAQSCLGDMLADAGDTTGALRWYQAAATQGESFAQNNLAVRLRDDFGQRRAAIPWFRAAAEQGHSDAQVSLGYALFEGEGTKRNQAEALRWYRAAARQGHVRAIANIAMMYRAGDVVKANPETARRWFYKAAIRGHARAQYAMSEMSKKPMLSLQWLMHAAGNGHSDAQIELGIAYHEGNHPSGAIARDYASALHWYRAAAEQGATWAWYLIGLCFRDGEGVPRSKPTARTWLRRAAPHHREARQALQKLNGAAKR